MDAQQLKWGLFKGLSDPSAPKPEPSTKPGKGGASRNQRPFVMADTEWLFQAYQLSPMMGNFAGMLWTFHYMDKGNVISVTTKKLAVANVAKRTSERLLDLLKDAGLITLDRHNGRAPKVRLLVPTEPLTFAKLKKRLGISEDADV
jgi:hypothetical protein